MAPQPKNQAPIAPQAPQAPVTRSLQMDTSNFPASALSEVLINKDLAPSKIYINPGTDCVVDATGMVSPLFTTPSAEKLAAGKVPFPYITFETSEGTIYRVYGNTAKAVVNTPTWTVEGEYLVAGIEVLANVVKARPEMV